MEGEREMVVVIISITRSFNSPDKDASRAQEAVPRQAQEVQLMHKSTAERYFLEAMPS